jgi:hypothetical protein
VTASVRRGDAAPCRDLRDVALPPLVADATAPGAVTLAIGGESSVESDDPLRTRCPGPGRGDLVGGGALASGSVAAAGLAGPTARVRLVAAPVRRAARLDARLSGEVEVRLRRTGARVRVVRDWVFVEGGA